MIRVCISTISYDSSDHTSWRCDDRINRIRWQPFKSTDESYFSAEVWATRTYFRCRTLEWMAIGQMGDCWIIMTHIITICTEHGVVVQINYVTKEIALLSFVISHLRCINDRRSIWLVPGLRWYETVSVHGGLIIKYP